MNVPLLDLKPQMEGFRDEIIRELTEIVDSTAYILGPKVEQFEQAVAQYCNVSSGIGVSSGTDALLLSLMALDIGPGDYVLTTPYTFFATAGCVVRTGASPVFVDIEADTMNMDPDRAAEKLAQYRKAGKRIKAIIPVHLFGQCVNMQKITKLADEYDLLVIEDAAQAIGAEAPFKERGDTTWKKAGAMGTTGCFSFFPSKNLGGIGDGGMVVTNDEKLAEKLRIFRNHGAAPKYYHSHVGGNFRLDPVQAAVLNIKLPHLERWHLARRKNAEIYQNLFEQSGVAKENITLPTAVHAVGDNYAEHNYHIYNQYVIRTSQRDRLKNHLLDKGIGCEIYYPLCLHQQKCFKNLGMERLSFPVAEQTAANSLALPIYPELSSEQLQYVAQVIIDFYRAG
ncbi:MAG: DegT/DnrJ/EryC1/StrS family aminotransferase [Desulfobulbaceae bacterium]|nr:DegT/DnrJ/EryC1/StrS family aminotransferase [Desulfobulbaceae bacterium]